MVDRVRVKGGALVGALLSGALAVGVLGGAPAANATCASFFGIGNSADCTSNPLSIAIAIGTGATAHADGLFGAAFSAGTNASASTADVFTFAMAAGDGAFAFTKGVFGLAAQLGRGDAFTLGSGGPGNIGANIAIGVTPGTTGVPGTSAGPGFGNIAINLFGNASGLLTHQVNARGMVNVAANLGGSDNQLFAGVPNGALNLAFNAFGSGDSVSAGPGPLAIAGSIGQNGATVTKVGPGFAIGTRVGGAAAVRSSNTYAPTATAVRTGNKTAAPTAATHTRTQKPAPAATATGRKK